MQTCLFTDVVARKNSWLDTFCSCHCCSLALLRGYVVACWNCCAFSFFFFRKYMYLIDICSGSDYWNVGPTVRSVSPRVAPTQLRMSNRFWSGVWSFWLGLCLQSLFGFRLSRHCWVSYLYTDELQTPLIIIIFQANCILQLLNYKHKSIYNVARDSGPVMARSDTQIVASHNMSYNSIGKSTWLNAFEILLRFITILKTKLLYN